MPDTTTMVIKRPTWDEVCEDLSTPNVQFTDALRNIPNSNANANNDLNSVRIMNELMETKRMLDEKTLCLAKLQENIKRSYEFLIKTYALIEKTKLDIKKTKIQSAEE